MSSQPQRLPAATPPVSRETHESARVAVRDLLERTPSFQSLAPAHQRELAHNLVQIGSYLAEPDGIRLPRSQPPGARALAGDQQQSGPEDGKFTAQGAREGAAVAGALLQAVNFPEFVAGLIDGVFHSIVQSSMQQMEAYSKLVSDVAKSLNEFRDENVTQNQGRDQLVEQFPDLFQLSIDTGGWGDFGSSGDSGTGSQSPAGPRVTLREGVNEPAAIARLNQSLPLAQPLSRLDDDLVESVLVPAARTQVASSRQQLLATMVMLGINRIVVTDGKISAKVMYDFQARDNMQFRRSAQNFDYDKRLTSTTNEGAYEGSSQSSSRGYTRSADGAIDTGGRDASYYSKGTYKSTSQPVLKLASASQTSLDASLTAKASLAGSVEVNFKSDYLPLEKMANPEAIAAIQMNAQPGMVKTVAQSRGRGDAGTPAQPSQPAR
ncbi:hypothetical protein [uncultured Thiodictyon sp.]|uniref:hypothetical protein n=1 Tax=uncultured Thiodictyon sp. TaxID=1846217 RepID=UPI0025FBA8BD|nr:hypothetical protein [uncultured Thiodictyon sp.]